MSSVSGKQIATLFFTRDDPRGSTWVCRCGKKCQQKGTGYSNLVSHVMRSHHELYKQVLEKKSLPAPSVMDSFWPKKAMQIHAWLLLIIDGLLPFSFCENKHARSLMKHAPITRKTFMKYLLKLSSVVEKKISAALPDTLALVFTWLFLLLILPRTVWVLKKPF